jgi:hypothetical protein
MDKKMDIDNLYKTNEDDKYYYQYNLLIEDDNNEKISNIRNNINDVIFNINDEKDNFYNKTVQIFLISLLVLIFTLMGIITFLIVTHKL